MDDLYATLEPHIIQSFSVCDSRYNITAMNSVHVDRFIKLVKKNNFVEYTDDYFKKYKQDEFLALFLETISILGIDPKIDFKIIDAFFKKLNPNDGSSGIFDGGYYQFTNLENNKKEECIEVHYSDRYSYLAALVHEFAHFYLSQKIISFKNIEVYEEVFSILFEKVSTSIIKKYNHDDNYMEKIESTRLNGLKYHLVDREVELKNFSKLIKRDQMLNKKIDKELLEYYNWISDNSNRKKYDKYYKYLTYKYLVGYIVSENLFTKFLDDKKGVNIAFNKMFNHEFEFMEMIDYFGINLNKKDTMAPAVKKMNLVLEYLRNK